MSHQQISLPTINKLNPQDSHQDVKPSPPKPSYSRQKLTPKQKLTEFLISNDEKPPKNGTLNSLVERYQAKYPEFISSLNLPKKEINTEDTESISDFNHSLDDYQPDKSIPQKKVIVSESPSIPQDSQLNSFDPTDDDYLSLVSDVNPSHDVISLLYLIINHLTRLEILINKSSEHHKSHCLNITKPTCIHIS